MKIKELHPKPIIWMTQSETLAAAAKCLAAEEIGALLIENSSGPVGMFSERDLARAVADDADLARTPVDEYMTESPVEIDLDAPLSDAIAAMNEFAVRHVVVCDGDDEIGMISVRDILKVLVGEELAV